MGGSGDNAGQDPALAGRNGRIRLAHERSIRLGPLTVEPALRRIAHDGGREELVEPRVMQVLIALARSLNTIITRDDLVEWCWHGVVVGDDAITRVIGRLRRLAEGIGEGVFRIETHPRVGYRLVSLHEAPPPVEPSASMTAPHTPSHGPNAEGPHSAGSIALHGERRYIYALITDVDGFSAQARGLAPEIVAELLNAYMEQLSQVVLEHGGIVDKILGDNLIAFWGAPVARHDDGERAARAAIASWRVGEAFRNNPRRHHPALGRTRVGLHRGDAIVGNFGAEGRATYSALGDALTVAFAIGNASKVLNAAVLASREAVCPSMRSVFRHMGRLRLRSSAALEVLDAAPDFPPDATERLNAAYSRFESGDVDALKELSALSAQFPNDAALEGLFNRLASVGPGGAFQLN